MKPDEERFFKTCFYCRNKGIDIRTVIYVLYHYINYKRCWYLLEKWSDKGFYNYGVTLDLGWFEIENMPKRYLELIDFKRGDGNETTNN